MSWKPAALVTLMAAAGLATPAAADAQAPLPGGQPASTQSRRPYRGLFGGGGGAGQTTQQLVLNLSLAGAHFDDLTDPGTTSSAGQGRSRGYGSGSASLSYGLSRERISGSLTASARGRYVPERATPMSGTYSVNGALSATLGPRARVSASHNIGLLLINRAALSGSQIGVWADPNTPVDPSVFTDDTTYQSSNSNVQFGYSLAERLSVNAGYGYHTNDAWSSSGSGRYSVQHGNVGMSYAWAKGLSLHAAYGYTESTSGVSGANYRGRTIDGGIMFNRALSLSRRATLTFSTGLGGLSDVSQRTRYHATGHVNLSYELGRSWNINSRYHRSASFDQTLAQPVLRDSLGTAVDGLIGRRLNVSASANVVKGRLGFGSSLRRYTAGSADLGLQIGVTREVAFGVNYTYYRHQFDAGIQLPTGLRSATEGQTVRASLQLSLPLLTRARRN